MLCCGYPFLAKNCGVGLTPFWGIRLNIYCIACCVVFPAHDAKLLFFLFSFFFSARKKGLDAAKQGDDARHEGIYAAVRRHSHRLPRRGVSAACLCLACLFGWLIDGSIDGSIAWIACAVVVVVVVDSHMSFFLFVISCCHPVHCTLLVSFFSGPCAVLMCLVFIGLFRVVNFAIPAREAFLLPRTPLL